MPPPISRCLPSRPIAIHYLHFGRQVWYSLTFKNDVEVIKKAGKLHDALVQDLQAEIPNGFFSTQCLFQPMPRLFAEHSVARGGNVLGLDQVKKNALLWLITGSTTTLKHQKIMEKKLAAFSATLEKFAEARDAHVRWQYLNYVDKSQNPLKSYGEPNVEFIRKVSTKYDPAQMFQKKVVSGWKISKIDDASASP